ncbi:fungal-specific transcription factor [Penicillium verrucosum]|uniref:fungal-specific transcription factor n=1 Tax=Penicillium verrucosum TaxID=60171 RepID=UPI00254598EF|nr:fungal-specific transcription factor [Penicillium verrucosum]KAJ5944338.1 fungal-specific transcription factor [Penicillium verrucosum]
MNHQFLTATMILCSMLHRGQTLEREQDIRAALHRCRAIWMRRSGSSKEAKKAAETVNFVLARADDGRRHNIALTQAITRSGSYFPLNDVSLDSLEPAGSLPGDTTVSSDYMSLFDRESLSLLRRLLCDDWLSWQLHIPGTAEPKLSTSPEFCNEYEWHGKAA